MKRKPAGERGLVEFTRRVFRPPAWVIGLHSCGVKIERVDQSVKGEWILPLGTSEENPVIYYLHGSGESVLANSERDPMFVAEDMERYASLYLGSQSRKDPLASPLHGDFTDLPPLLCHVGETECLLDDARNAHAKMLAAGGVSELRVFKRVPHGWQFGMPFVPEARASLRDIADFIQAARERCLPPAHDS